MEAARRLLGFFPRSAAADPEIFLAGLVELLAGYPQAVIDRAVSVRGGLPSRSEFCPSLAEVAAFCNDVEEQERQHEELLARWERPALPPPAFDLPSRPRNEATRSALCERYGIRDVPPGWDAVDVVRAAAKYGDRLPAVVDEMLASGAGAGPSIFQRIVEKSQAAKREATLGQKEAAE